MFSFLLSLIFSAQAVAGGCSDLYANQIIHGTVERVVDGDTVRVIIPEGSASIRVLGIDTPETHYHGKSQGRWAEAATEYLQRALPKGENVKLVFDVEPCDAYGRFLAYVETGKIDVGLEEGRVCGQLLYRSE